MTGCDFKLEDARKHGTLLIGERQPKAIITEARAKEIRLLLKEGRSNRSLAEQFGVCKYTIWAISSGRHWGHVQ